MGARVVLDQDARDAEPRGEPRRLDERCAAGIQRQDGLAIERQPLAVAPERPGTRRDRVARGEHPCGIDDRIEGAEALLADRNGGWLMECAARSTDLRPGP